MTPSPASQPTQAHVHNMSVVHRHLSTVADKFTYVHRQGTSVHHNLDDALDIIDILHDSAHTLAAMIDDFEKGKNVPPNKVIMNEVGALLGDVYEVQHKIRTSRVNLRDMQELVYDVEMDIKSTQRSLAESHRSNRAQQVTPSKSLSLA